MSEARGYQTTIIEQARRHFQSGKRRVLVQAPTGSGKTTLSARMLGGAAARGHRSFFLVHRRELLRQASRTFTAAGISHGVIAAGGDIENGHCVQIASIGTLAKRCQTMAPPHFLVWDECHHLPAPGWSSLQDAFPDAFQIGLTATPERLDGKGLGGHFDVMVPGPAVRYLQRQGYLARCRHHAPSDIDLTGVRKQRGDYVAGDLAAAVERSSLFDRAVASYQQFTPGKRAIVFAVNVGQSARAAAAFRAAGIPAEHVDGKTPFEQRDAALARFESGETLVLTNVDLFREGLDVPALEVVIMMRATASLALFLQMIGRALRPGPGKEHAVVLDLVGNWHRHGLVDEDRRWSLDPPLVVRARRNDLRVCDACSLVSLPQPFCTACGAPPRPRRASDAAVWQELVADPALLKRLRHGSLSAACQWADSESRLRMVALARGFKVGWAYHRWQDITQARGAA